MCFNVTTCIFDLVSYAFSTLFTYCKIWKYFLKYDSYLFFPELCMMLALLGKQQFVSYDIEKLGNTYLLTPSSPQIADKN